MTNNDAMTNKIKELWNTKNLLENSIKESKNALDEINIQLNDIIKPEVSLLREMQGKETGIVNLNINGSLKIKHNVPKKVKWDQGILSNIAEQIRQAGSNIADYMGIKYDVPEKLWSMFDADTQEAFKPARTVEHGKPTIEIDVIA